MPAASRIPDLERLERLERLVHLAHTRTPAPVIPDHRQLERMARFAAEGQLEEAVRDWMTEWATDEDMTALAESGYLEACATYVPVLLQALEQGEEEAYSPTDPSVLSQIKVPVLIVHGSEAESVWPWFTESVGCTAEYVPDASVREIPGAGHMGGLGGAATLRRRAHALI